MLVVAISGKAPRKSLSSLELCTSKTRTSSCCGCFGLSQSGSFMQVCEWPEWALALAASRNGQIVPASHMASSRLSKIELSRLFPGSFCDPMIEQSNLRGCNLRKPRPRNCFGRSLARSRYPLGLFSRIDFDNRH